VIDRNRLESAYLTAREALLAERNAEGFWVGELSSSALAGAVACIALHLIDKDRHAGTIRKGMDWLIATQNPDGGWGDTTKSFSNISTSMLIRAAFAVCDATHPTIETLEKYLDEKCGKSQAERAEAIRNRYGTDRTFSVPILMTSALAGLIPWHEVPRLPFEAAALPQSWYRFARMPVVSYALPALIAIGQCIHHHRPSWNPFTEFTRWLTAKRTQRVLQRIQPSSGGYLEATPLTAFVCMSLQSLPASKRTAAADVVLKAGERFLLESMRPDGSWPIDTNLSIWVTTLSVNALASGKDLKSLPDKQKTIDWLLTQQLKEVHPYTGAAPGGWGWSHCPGSVPDCDDTPGAVIALRNLGYEGEAIERGQKWIMDLQNRDGGFPTFCKGWGKLPFDRSGADLTAHALRAINGLPGNRVNVTKNRALKYLETQMDQQRGWYPLWFGNQHMEHFEWNWTYGTSKVLCAFRDLQLSSHWTCDDSLCSLLDGQNSDGGWGGNANDLTPSSVEETALAFEIIIDLITEYEKKSSNWFRERFPNGSANQIVRKGLEWLLAAVESGRFREPAPIGFYFAKLWYFEKLYPLIFTVAALGAARRHLRFDDLDHDARDVVP
jgi:squalene-hopene/tetraprenyl-beta-curcumene cyclase